MLIKNNFKIGQKLRVVEQRNKMDTVHQAGDIVEVGRGGSIDTFYCSCHPSDKGWFWARYTDLELVEDKVENKAGFKVGQKVRVIRSVNKIHDGEIVTVGSIGYKNTKFYDTCNLAHYFSSSLDELEIVEESVPTSELKVGDRVRAKATTKEEERYNGMTFSQAFLKGDTTVQSISSDEVYLKNGFYIGKDAIEVIPRKELSVTFPTLGGTARSSYSDFDNKLEKQMFGDWDIDFYKPKRKEKSTMQKLTTLAKKLLDPDTKALMEAEWLDSELDLTEDGKTAILVWLLEQNKAALAKEAKDLLAEEKKAKKGE